MARPAARGLLVILSLLAPACVAEGLSFVQDRRVEIVAPEGNKMVSLPVTVRWTVEDFRITGPDGRSSEDAGYFAVFVDDTAIPPGKPLSWVARDDQACLDLPDCPDQTYLADRLIYTTTDTQFTIPNLPDQDTHGGHETHEVTVVLLDGQGRRIGEGAWFVTFFYDREA